MKGRHRGSARWALVLLALGGGLLPLLATAPPVHGHPKPAAVPYRWELEFEPGDLRLYTDPASGETYWFMTYKVSNRTGRDQLWAPSFTLFNDGGEILPSGRDVPAGVVSDLLEVMGNEFLEEQNAIIGNLLHGRQHAKEGLVVWPARNLTVNEMSVFVRGISGESTRVANPVSGEQVTLYKTLQLDYLVRGNPVPRGPEPIEQVEKSWVMR